VIQLGTQILNGQAPVPAIDVREEFLLPMEERPDAAGGVFVLYVCPRARHRFVFSQHWSVLKQTPTLYLRSDILEDEFAASTARFASTSPFVSVDRPPQTSTSSGGRFCFRQR
jgi:hypothetical protein